MQELHRQGLICENRFGDALFYGEIQKIEDKLKVLQNKEQQLIMRNLVNVEP